MFRNIKSVDDERRAKKGIAANFKSWLQEQGRFTEFMEFQAKDLMITKLQTFVAQDFSIPLSWSWYMYGPAVIGTNYVSASDLIDLEPADNCRKELDPLFRKEYRHFEETKTVNQYLAYVYNTKYKTELYSAKLALYGLFDESNKRLKNSKDADVPRLYDALSRFHLSLYDGWIADEVKQNDRLQQLAIEYTTAYAELIAKGNYLKTKTPVYLKLLHVAHDTFFLEVWKTYAYLISANTMSTFDDCHKKVLIGIARREHRTHFVAAIERFAELKREIGSNNFELTMGERKELAK